MGDVPEKMTPEEALQRLGDLESESFDVEAAHADADAVLLALLRFYGAPPDVITAWEAVPKWYA